MRKIILTCIVLQLFSSLSGKSFLSYKGISIVQEHQIDVPDKFFEELACGISEGISVEKVFPGDTNCDLVVNQEDLLLVGRFFLETGPSRNTNDISWSGQPSIPWKEVPESPVNLKHIDCNGDGIIDFQDLDVIRANFGKSRFGHSKKKKKQPPATTKIDLDVENFRFNDLDTTTHIGITVYLNAADSIDFYGITGELNIEGELNKVVKTLESEIESSWFYESGEEVLEVHNYDFGAKNPILAYLKRAGRIKVAPIPQK